MTTPLERYEYYAARVDRIGAARTRRIYWHLTSILVMIIAVMAAAAFVSQEPFQPGTRETASPSDLQAAAAEPDEGTTSTEKSVYYRNCREAWAAGAAPIYAGQPGYRAELDGDSDGIACEPFHR